MGMMSMHRRRGGAIGRQTILILALGGLAAPAAAQQAHVPVPAQAADPKDVGTIDGLMRAFYEVISGPAGQPRQWARDRTLYVPGVRFFMLSEKNGKPVANVVDHQQYVDGSDRGMVARGFSEREIHRRVERFGNVAHIWSTYETRTTPDGPLLGRGINSLQLYWDGTRWWVTSVAWDDERPDNPIPKEFLP